MIRIWLSGSQFWQGETAPRKNLFRHLRTEQSPEVVLHKRATATGRVVSGFHGMKTCLTIGGNWLFLGRCGSEWWKVGAMLLTGTFNRVLDEKLRIALPSNLREALHCQEGGGLYVTPGTDQSLTLYTEEAFQLLGQRLAQSPPTRQDVRAFSRLFYGQAQYVEIDRQGRIRIPQELAALAKLQKDVVLVGVQDHLELWALDVWNNYVADKQARFDEIAETALSRSRLPGGAESGQFD